MKLAGILVPLALVALAACSTSDPGRGSAADDSFTLPSDGADRTGGPVPPAGRTIRGVLSFDDIEGGCAFLESADGSRYEVVYPEGWVLERATGRLHGPDGEDVAPGTVIEVEGSIATDRASICQLGPIVIATRVVAPAP